MNSDKMKEIENARKLQNECVNAHMIPPILGILEIEKTNIEGKTEKHIHQKSNSYVRNAYNIIAFFLLGARNNNVLPTLYSNDGLGFKNIGGSVAALSGISTATVGEMYGRSFRIGAGTTPDILDDFNLESQVIITINTPNYYYSYEGNKLIATISCTMMNNLTYMVSISEVGIFGGNYLLIRDVFNTVNLQPLETITIKYTLELVYPS